MSDLYSIYSFIQREEERWATLGQAENGQNLVVIHTWRQPSLAIAVRLISARKATKGKYRITRSGRTSG